MRNVLYLLCVIDILCFSSFTHKDKPQLGVINTPHGMSIAQHLCGARLTGYLDYA